MYFDAVDTGLVDNTNLHALRQHSASFTFRGWVFLVYVHAYSVSRKSAVYLANVGSPMLEEQGKVANAAARVRDKRRAQAAETVPDPATHAISTQSKAGETVRETRRLAETAF